MAETMINELFRLAMRAINETDDYVEFEIGNYGYLCRISIMEGGFKEGGEFEGWYGLVSGNDSLAEKMRQKEFSKAKAHLERLIAKKRKVEV